MRCVVIGLSCASLLLACNVRTDDNACFIGEWRVADVDLSNAGDPDSPWYLVTHTYTFREDSTFASTGVYRRFGALEERSNVGTYTVDGNSLVLTFNGAEDKGLAASFECHGDQLVLQDHQTNVEVKMTRVIEQGAI